MIFIQKIYRIIFVVVCFITLTSEFAFTQETYSRTYDLEVGVNNLVETLIIDESGFLLATTHSGDTSVVSALTRFTLGGDILDQNSYSDYVINASRTSIRTNEGFELAGHTWSLDKNSSRGLELLKLNTSLEVTEQIVINVEDERTTNLPGILDVNDQIKVVYGSFVNTGEISEAGAAITLVDKSTDTIVQEIIFTGEEDARYRDFSVYDLQVTADSQFIFIVQTRQKNDSPTGTGSYFEIVKFNQDGEVINRVKHQRRGDNQALAQDDFGDIYFFEKEMPFFIDSIVIWSNGGGGIVKLNSEIDSVIWSLAINENDMIFNSRGHNILGIRQTKDNNILAFGEVRLTLDDPGGEEIGFLCKFTKEGEMLWVREYGIPIPEEFVELELIGVLGSARIEDCQELEDGRILCMGENAYRRPSNNAYRELWMLMLDDEGCLSPGCDATQILTNTSKVQTYNEGRIYPNPSTDILHISEVNFDAYKVYDVTGRLLQQGGFETRIDISGLPTGMHVLQLKEDNQLKSVFKFLKQ